jgi:phosphoserine phosphatase
MPTIVFDFDSTIISCESLEIILERRARKNPQVQNEIKQITESGIRGKISFSESLQKRLALASPSKEDAMDFGSTAFQWLTFGMEELIAELRSWKLDIWIVSGGIIESLIPLGSRLKIPRDHIHGVKLLWDEKGNFCGIDESIPFCRSKVEGCRSLTKKWQSPTIAVGDAMSDFRLFEEGIVEHFIAYTEHFQCKEVLEKGVKEAKNASNLKSRLREIIRA